MDARTLDEQSAALMTVDIRAQSSMPVHEVWQVSLACALLQTSALAAVGRHLPDWLRGITGRSAAQTRLSHTGREEPPVMTLLQDRRVLSVCK